MSDDLDQMKPTDLTAWLVFDDELFKEECVRRFSQAGLEISTVRWGEELLKAIPRFHPDDWVILDFEEVERVGPKFLAALRDLLRFNQVMVLHSSAPDVKSLGTGWIEVEKPINCATMCTVIRSLTGRQGCGEPGCCGSIRPNP